MQIFTATVTLWEQRVAEERQEEEQEGQRRWIWRAEDAVSVRARALYTASVLEAAMRESNMSTWSRRPSRRSASAFRSLFPAMDLDIPADTVNYTDPSGCVLAASHMCMSDN